MLPPPLLLQHVVGGPCHTGPPLLSLMAGGPRLLMAVLPVADLIDLAAAPLVEGSCLLFLESFFSPSRDFERRFLRLLERDLDPDPEDLELFDFVNALDFGSCVVATEVPALDSITESIG